MNRWQFFTERYGTFWNFYDYRRKNKYRIYKIIDKYLLTFKNKPFNDFYSFIVKKYPKLLREDIESAIESSIKIRNINSRRSNYIFYLEDDIIRYKGPSKKEEYVIKSPDYKQGIRHKYTKKHIEETNARYWWWRRDKPLSKNEEVYEMSGFRKVFNEKNDEYYKLKYENHQYLKKYRKKQKRKWKREESISEDKFRQILKKMTLEEINEERELKKTLKEKEINELKILSHGFCPETSFRTNLKFNK